MRLKAIKEARERARAAQGSNPDWSPRNSSSRDDIKLTPSIHEAEMDNIQSLNQKFIVTSPTSESDEALKGEGKGVVKKTFLPPQTQEELSSRRPKQQRLQPGTSHRRNNGNSPEKRQTTNRLTVRRAVDSARQKPGTYTPPALNSNDGIGMDDKDSSNPYSVEMTRMRLKERYAVEKQRKTLSAFDEVSESSGGSPPPTKMNVITRKMNNKTTINPPGLSQEQATLSGPMSTETSYDYTSIGNEPSSLDSMYSSQQGSGLLPSSYRGTRKGRDLAEPTTNDYSSAYLYGEETLWSEDGDYYPAKQKYAPISIAITATQLMLLLVQLLLCGAASVNVNPMIGPYPDAFSEWGGKNAYKMIDEQQFWRIVTPVFLHVGLIHFLANAYCQLDLGAFFEREWGSFNWIIIYIVSGVGAVATSSISNPDNIAVCSSGALMGLFGAKIAQTIGWTCFELRGNLFFESVHLDQLGSVMCNCAMVSLLCFLTYIDFASHMGGFTAGFLLGMPLFAYPIENCCIRFLWAFVGLLGIVGGSAVLAYLLYFEVDADEDLSDACNYFRNLYPEDYVCECQW